VNSISTSVRFVAFSELADWTVDVSPARLTPPSYEEERQSAFTDRSIHLSVGIGTAADALGYTALHDRSLGAADAYFVAPGEGGSFEEQRLREREGELARAV